MHFKIASAFLATAFLSSVTALPSEITKREPPAPVWPFGGEHLAPNMCALIYQWTKNLQTSDPNYHQVRMTLFDGVGVYLGDTVQIWTDYGNFVDIPSKLPHTFTAEVVNGFNPKADPEEWWINKAQYAYPPKYPWYKDIGYQQSTAECSDQWTCYAHVPCDG
jgi:hypothetical protein